MISAPQVSPENLSAGSASLRNLSPTDYAALGAIALAFGWSSAEPALAATVPNRRGKVLAYDDDAWEAACLLALLTGRRPRRRCAGTAELTRDIDVVVGLSGSLDDPLVQQLLGLARSSVLGIIVGRDPDELRLRALAAAIGARSRPETLPCRIALQPDWQVAHVDAGLFQIFGGTAQPAEMRRALQAGTTLVTLAGHGDGIDGELAAGLVLCPQDAAFAALASARPPLCRVTGQCHRVKTRLLTQDFRASTVHPAEIVTRALVWNSCVGWPALGGFIDRDYGVGMRLAASPRIGALITTDRVVIAPREITETLISELLRGMTLGRAVARHNLSPEARRHGHRLLLFGDPDCRVAPSLPRAVPASPSRRPVIRAATRGLTNLSARDRELGAVLGVLLTGSPGEPHTDAAWAELQEWSQAETLEGFWARTAHRTSPAPAAPPCPYCGLSTTDHALSTRHPVPQRRIVRVCPCCEVISDRSVGDRLDVRIEPKAVHLAGRHPAGPARAVVIVRRRWPCSGTLHPWDADGDGRLKRSMPLPAETMEMPVMVTVLVHARQTIGAFSRAVPADRLKRADHANGV